MRTTRIVILFLFLFANLFVLLRILASSTAPSQTVRPNPKNSRNSVFGFVYYNPPFSLFQPNAAISLTDDNSTTFAARPAAFGPPLSSNGLSGQLWVGSGFAEDSLESHGELGCSDIPGWEGGANLHSIPESSVKSTTSLQHTVTETKPRRTKRDNKKFFRESGTLATEIAEVPSASANDGTDNYLHEATRSFFTRRDLTSSHADIQSMQESAEIQGKVVLLMRGGCGFLEKVMWAQRRGAIAVIVGDNQRGGPLVNMFARGEDAENVTIPSVFTARTTAQLLSSLTQPGSFIEDSIDDGGNPVLRVQKGIKMPQKKTNDKRRESSLGKAKAVSNASKKISRNIKEKTISRKNNRGWLSRWLGIKTTTNNIKDQAGAAKPSRGMADHGDDENDQKISDNVKKNKNKHNEPTKPMEDEFRIGVQDWRDPDLIEKSHPSDKTIADGVLRNTESYNMKNLPNKKYGLLDRLFGEEEWVGEAEPVASGTDEKVDLSKPNEPNDEPHQGLWVTITPNSSASPFFDTLLVLVVSPLVTLSIVYALLLLRARIRRRRWRAPKSVVERLPVRTYHTVVASPSLSPQASSPATSSPTTPLLQHSSSRPRPRSRTTTGIPESENLMISSASVPTAASGSRSMARNEHEKGSSGFSAEWRKYMGRQVECVVCLEEYIDGVSRVMRLPCGHEFHADCITPWLTTRRRTCPICKGDVVRSLAHSSRSTPMYESYHEDSEDDAVASSGVELDIEQSIVHSASQTGQSSRTDGLLGIFSQSLGNRWHRVSSRPPSTEHSRHDSNT